VASAGKKYVLRIYSTEHRRPRTKENILFEINTMKFFARYGIPIPAVVVNKKGEVVTEIGGRFAAMFEFIEGDHRYGRIKANHFSQIGQMIATIHNLTEKEKIVCDNIWETNFVDFVLQKVAQNQNILTNEELHIAALIKQKQTELSTLPQWFIHSDYYFGNLLFREDKLVAVLDFDDYCLGNFLEDITRFFVAELAYSESSYFILTQEFVNAFWDGYLKARPLIDRERGLIEDYLKIHYLNQLIRLASANPKKIPGFKKQVKELKEFTGKYFKFQV